MPKHGDVRSDGFVWYGDKWRSPAGIEGVRTAVKAYNSARQYTKSSATKANLGQSAELLVASDLLYRGLPVTKPLNVNGAHDLHAKVGTAWLTFQVKCGVLLRSNQIVSPRGQVIESDILALVWVPSRRVRYVPLNIAELPDELIDELVQGPDVPLCQET